MAQSERQEAELEAAEAKMLSFFAGATRMERIRTEDIRGLLDVLEMKPEKPDRGGLDV